MRGLSTPSLPPWARSSMLVRTLCRAFGLVSRALQAGFGTKFPAGFPRFGMEFAASLGINSPSKEMAWVGEMLVQGLAGSIQDNGKQAVSAAEKMSSDIDGVMNKLAQDMQTAIPTDYQLNANANVTGGMTGAAFTAAGAAAARYGTAG